MTAVFANPEALAEALSPHALGIRSADDFALSDDELEGVVMTLAGAPALSMLHYNLNWDGKRDPIFEALWNCASVSWVEVAAILAEQQFDSEDPAPISITTLNGAIPTALQVFREAIPAVIATPLTTPAEQSAAIANIQRYLGSVTAPLGTVFDRLGTLLTNIKAAATNTASVATVLSSDGGQVIGPVTGAQDQYLADAGTRVLGYVQKALPLAQAAVQHLEGIVSAWISDLQNCVSSMQDVGTWLQAPASEWQTLLPPALQLATQNWMDCQREVSVLNGQFLPLFNLSGYAWLVMN